MKVILCSFQPDIIKKWTNVLRNQFSDIEICDQENTLLKILSSPFNTDNFVIIYHLKSNATEELQLTQFINTHPIAKHMLILVNSPKAEQGIHFLHLGIHGYANAHISNEKLITATHVISQGEIWAGEDILLELLKQKLSNSEQPIDKRSKKTNHKKQIQSNNNENELNNNQANAKPIAKPIANPIANPIAKQRRISDLLSKRENEVFDEMLKGKTNKEIANAIYITERTVKAHVSSIFKKTKSRNRFELLTKFQNY